MGAFVPGEVALCVKPVGVHRAWTQLLTECMRWRLRLNRLGQIKHGCPCARALVSSTFALGVEMLGANPAWMRLHPCVRLLVGGNVALAGEPSGAHGALERLLPVCVRSCLAALLWVLNRLETIEY